MLTYFYPASLRRDFTDREKELALLSLLSRRTANGRPQRLAVMGLRRIGKTVLLKEFVARTLSDGDGPVWPVYVNCEEIAVSPERFALGLIGSACYWYLRQGEGNPTPFFRLETLPAAVMGSDSPAIAATITLLQREWRAVKPDRPALVRQAFGLIEELSQEQGRPAVLILDEFPDLLALSNYPETRNILALFRSFCQVADHVSVILTGSAVSVMERLIGDPESAIFLQFERVPLRAFGREASDALTRKRLRELTDSPPAEVVAAVRWFSGGHPFYITRLCERLIRFCSLYDLPLDEGLVRQAFLAETLSPDGGIYGFCKYTYDLSLQKARGYGALKTVLLLLAQDEPLPLAELARRLKVSAPTALQYLRWLLEVDLIQEGQGGYRHRDPVLRYWLAHTAAGIELDPYPRRADVADLLARLDEQFQRAATELGRAKEAEVRELLRRCGGRRAPGRLLGQSDDMILPAFVHVEGYRSPDGQVEVDALAETAEGVRWAVEVKWRGKAAGEKELAALRRSAQALEAQPWFISRSGFTPAARAYAAEQGILLSTAADLEQLGKLTS